MPLVYSLVPKPFHRPIYAVLPSTFWSLAVLQAIRNWTVGTYTASDQKLDGGKAWKRTVSDQKLDGGKAWKRTASMQSKTWLWEGLGTRLSLVMVIWLGYSGDAQLELLAGFKSHLRSEVWASCNFLNEHSRTLLIGIPKPNSRCSSLPSVAEVPYMEGFIFICKWKLHVAVERTAWS